MFFYQHWLIINRMKSQKKSLQVQMHYKKRDKRASLLASQKGSMTVEAAIVLPILLCALMGIIMWGKVLIANQTMETALLETARQLARKEYLYSLKGTEGASISTTGILFQKIRKQGNGEGGIGVSAVNFIGSEYDANSKEIRLRITYKIKLPMFLLGSWQLRIRSGLNQKAWNGYAPAYGEKGSENRDYVYVTEDGGVYHQDGQCYHLHITIHETEHTETYYAGQTAYRPCEHCIHSSDGKADVLYIPEEGDCYHSDPSCSGLTRTVRYVKKEEIGTMRPCSHCSQGKRGN